MDYNGASALAARIQGKAKRTLLRAPIVSSWSEYRYFARLGKHAENLPWLDRDQFDLLAELREQGLAVRDVSNMVPPAVLEVADRFLGELRTSNDPDCTVSVSQGDLAAHPAVYKWGLDDSNLDLAEFHIGLPVQYLGVGVKRERADGRTDCARQWHLDVEDRRMLKIIVYLSDVDEGCGPFEYVNRQSSTRAAETLGYTSGYISDSALARAVPAEDWIQVTAPRLSAIFVDTTKVFHRAQPPTSADRYSMTFSYSSRTPYQKYPEWMLSSTALSALSSELTPRQRRAVLAV